MNYNEQLELLINNALAEDIGDGDHSTISSIDSTAQGKAILKIKEDGVLAGMEVAEKVPMEAVTASASGLDPHISPKNAMLQASRVAKARNLNKSDVERVVKTATEGMFFGIFGEEKVNVVKLNLSLDKEFGKAKI